MLTVVVQIYLKKAFTLISSQNFKEKMQIRSSVNSSAKIEKKRQ